MPLRLAIVLLGMVWFTPTVGIAQDWPRFLGVNFDGSIPDPDVPFDWTSKPKLIWSIDVGEGYGIGTVADGRYLHFDATPMANGFGINERLRSFDVRTGKEQWSHSQPIQYQDMYGYEDGPRSSASIDGDLVFTLGVSGMLTCRQLASGNENWSVSTGEKYNVVQNFFGVGSSPLVWQDQVIVMVGGSPAEDRRIAPGRLDRVAPNGTALVAFDRQTGKERWKCGEDLASYSSPRLIQIEGQTLVLLFARGGLLAVDPIAGEVRWRLDHRAEIVESVNAMTPVVDGDRVFISECYEVGSALLKVSLSEATVLWIDPAQDRRRQSMRCHWATPILVDGFLYGCSGRNSPDSDLRCIDWSTGEVQWTDPRRIRTSLTRVGDHLLVLEERGALQVIKANSKRLELVAEWNLSIAEDEVPAIDYPCWAAPIVVGDRLLLRGTQRVLCMQLQTTGQ